MTTTAPTAAPSPGRRSGSLATASTTEELLAALTEEGVPLDRLPPPCPADGVQLLGRMTGSGHRSAPGLVRRHDGQTVQLTPLLYRILQAMDGRRTYAEIAAWIGGRINRDVAAGDVVFLAETKLRPLGLLRHSNGTEPEVERANPLLALRCKIVVTDPETTRRITAPFARLFHPAAVAFFLVAFALVTGWVAFSKGLGSATHQAFYEPLLLLLVVGLTIISAGFHEFGHAAACRYGGATPGTMGAGLYLVWPAFYTDVSDSYTLDRRGRLRVDLGGLYFNAIFAVGVFAVWAVVGWDALLLVIGTQVLQMLRQLTPLVRFDGYHILADLTGVPDLFSHIKPILLGLLPHRWGDPRNRVLKRWVRVVVTTWVLVVIPALAALLVVMISILPRLAATAWDSLGMQLSYLAGNYANGDLPRMGVGIVSILALCIPVLSITYLLARIARRTVRRLWAFAGGDPARRGGVMLAGLLVLAGVGWLWAHSGGGPIEPDERGTVHELFGLLAYEDDRDDDDRTGAEAAGRTQARGQPDARGNTTVAAGSTATQVPSAGGGRATDRPDGAGLPAGTGPPPHAHRPDDAGPPADQGPPPGRGAPPDRGTPPDRGPQPEPEPPVDEWPFPFPPPGIVGPYDNRAYVYNATDGSTQHDVALSYVETDRSPVTNRNEAWALASCRECKTVAVAFQVVLITTDEVEVVVPQNTSVAVNSECESCITHGVSTQLVVSLTRAPGPQTRGQIQALLGRLQPLRAQAASLPLEQVRGALLATKAQILQVLATAEPGAKVLEDTTEESGEDEADQALEIEEPLEADESLEIKESLDIGESSDEDLGDTAGPGGVEESPADGTAPDGAEQSVEDLQAGGDEPADGEGGTTPETESPASEDPAEEGADAGAEHQPAAQDEQAGDPLSDGDEEPSPPPAKEPDDGTEVLHDEGLQEVISPSQSVDTPDDEDEGEITVQASGGATS